MKRGREEEEKEEREREKKEEGEGKRRRGRENCMRVCCKVSSPPREATLAEMGIAIQDHEGRAVGVMQPKKVRQLGMLAGHKNSRTLNSRTLEQYDSGIAGQWSSRTVE